MAAAKVKCVDCGKWFHIEVYPYRCDDCKKKHNRKAAAWDKLVDYIDELTAGEEEDVSRYVGTKAMYLRATMENDDENPDH